MICAVLAAGYATRLYPLTENFPKPLLKVKDKPILDWLLNDIDQTGAVTRYVIISNHKFVDDFNAWAETAAYKAPITVLNDGSISNETRLGAVKDVQFAIDALKIDEPMLVIAGDNLLSFTLGHLIDYARDKGTSCLMRYEETDTSKLKKCGVMQIDDSDRVLRMEEKPQVPFSTWCAPPFYYYTREDLPLIAQAISSGVNVDAPGSLMAYMAGQTAVHAMQMPGRRYDIGNLESYAAVQEAFMQSF